MLRALGHLGRLSHAGWVLAREGVFADVDPALMPPAARLPLRLAKLITRRGVTADEHRLSRAMARLGPSYVKLGQFLATRPDIVGVAAAHELEQLQDRLPPFPQAQAIATIEASLGQPISEIFLEFGQPIAAASIGVSALIVTWCSAGAGCASSAAAIRSSASAIRVRSSMSVLRRASTALRRFPYGARV